MHALVVSDLHVEFRGGSWRCPFDVSPSDYDVVVCAGDVHSGVNGVHWLQKQWPAHPVVYVPGNHEYYGHTTAVVDLIRDAARGTNVHVLDRDVFVLDGVRFAGATLWTDLELCGDGGIHTMRGLNDWRLIKNLRRDWWVSEHHHSVMWLHEQLREHPNTVIVTHYLPHTSIHPKWRNSLTNSGFASDLSSIFARDPALWIHGHTHDRCDYVHHNGITQVVCNPMGYPGEYQNQQPLVVNIQEAAA
jgi:Icc-related predicted phosphoesterase